MDGTKEGMRLEGMKSMVVAVGRLVDGNQLVVVVVVVVVAAAAVDRVGQMSGSHLTANASEQVYSLQIERKGP